MSKAAIKQAIKDGYIRTKNRCIASAVCTLGWFVFSFLNNGFEKSDAWICIILLCVTVVYADVAARYQRNLRKAEELGY